VQSGKAKNFYMRTGPTVLVLSTLNREILQLTSLAQTNPNNRSGERLLKKKGKLVISMAHVTVRAGITAAGHKLSNLANKAEQTVNKWYDKN